MKGIVQPSLSKVRIADTLWRGRESEWEMKEAPEAPSGSPEGGEPYLLRVRYCSYTRFLCCMVFVCSFSNTGLFLFLRKSIYFPFIISLTLLSFGQ